jgi:hypothetical protein
VKINKIQVFRPELISRHGESLAWCFTIFIGLSLGVILLRSGTIPSGAWAFLFLFFLIGLFISLGNWVDRHTIISIALDGITFSNGLRHTRLKWSDIQKVNVLSVRWGKLVQVIGVKSHFEFRTLSEVLYKGDVKGRVGFSNGFEILDQILYSSGLQLITKTGNEIYYSRL